MTHPKPSDMANRRLQAVKDQQVEDLRIIDRSLSDVDYIMTHFINQGMNTTEAIQLTDLTLSNLIEEN